MIVTFDFDDTLTQPVWSQRYQLFEPSDTPNLDSIAKVRDFFLSGKEVKIVTTRWRDEEIVEFVRLHDLPISSIHCTKGELKAPKLRQLGSQLHFDDNQAEAIANQKLGIPTVIVSFKFDRVNQKEVCEFLDYQ